MSFANFDRGVMIEEVRPRQSGRLRTELVAGNFPQAAAALRDFLDTWPVAELVDGAVERWEDGEPTPVDLCILGRAAQLLGLDMVPVSQPPADGGVVTVHGSELVSRRRELARKLARGEIGAVRVEPPPPLSPAVSLALGELRLEGEQQRSFELYGPAALRVGAPPPWSKVLTPAPAGVLGDLLRRRCASAVLPATVGGLARGELAPVAYLMFRGPQPAVAAQPAVASLLDAFGTGCSVADAATKLEVAAGDIQPAVDELVSLGALSA